MIPLCVVLEQKVGVQPGGFQEKVDYCHLLPKRIGINVPNRGCSLDRLRTWALDVQERRGHNKAAVALANKLARIVWATWRHERDFSGKA